MMMPFKPTRSKGNTMKFKSLALALKASALALVAFTGFQGTASAATAHETLMSSGAGAVSGPSVIEKMASGNKNTQETLALSKGLRINPACDDDGSPCPHDDTTDDAS
ncbi:hypothetical protein NXS97_00410 [Pantoea sp. B623]|uniref:hypothetical protein n=1 Tax=Pantoea sp. B623 TaxID=2974561 RepID=UPI002166E1E9|nr:hypothetical protein [Pantoea sp. B623]MCS4492676.1 hypothetical protein [Pantoea sp. B623]